LKDQAVMLQLMSELEKTIAQRDTSGVLSLMKKLAQRGHHVSSADVAQLYEVGQKPVELSLDLAFSWYKRSAYEEVDKNGYLGLGRFYFDGRHVEKDTKASTELFKQAAAMGSTEASILVGLSYLGAHGAERDLEQAKHYLLPAANAGYVAAFFLLARVALARRQYLSAAKFWLKSVYCGHSLSKKNKLDPRLYLLHSIWKT
jgi:TPR repeat protein